MPEIFVSKQTLIFSTDFN